MTSETTPEEERLAVARALRHVGDDVPTRGPEEGDDIARLLGEDREPDLDYERGEETQGVRTRVLQGLVGLLVLACLALVVPLALDFFGGGSGDEVPLITADGTPNKVRPEEPGGLQVPHQDLEVMNPGDAPTVERLLPPPETPEPLTSPSVAAGGSPSGAEMALSQAVPDPASEGGSLEARVPTGATSRPEQAESLIREDPRTPEIINPAPVTLVREPAADSGTQEVSSAAPPIQESPGQEPVGAEPFEAAADKSEARVAEAPPLPVTAVPKPAAEKPGATQEAVIAPAPASASAEGGIFIQLGSLANREAIPAEWERLQDSFPDFLGDMKLAVQSVTIDGRGTFHRIQTGPLPNRSTAEEMCSFLKGAKQACIVVQR